MNGTVISKSELARRLKVSKTMVTKYVQRGLPTTVDGKVEWAAAKDWLANNNIPQLSGSHEHRRSCHASAARQTPEDFANALLAPENLTAFARALMMRFKFSAREAYIAAECCMGVRYSAR